MAPPVALAALFAFTLVSALPQHHVYNLSVRQANSTEICTNGATIPNLWSVQDLKIIYSSDDGRTPSNATFSVTNTRANTTETLTCNLRANYQCAFTGTPQNKDLSIWMQLNLVAYFSFAQTQACGRATASITGMAEMDMICKGESLEVGMTCAGDGGPSYATGTVEVTPASGGGT